ncbi:MAG: hypothetical protein WBM84_04270 [Sedimenticolaceae bacterium]
MTAGDLSNREQRAPLVGQTIADLWWQGRVAACNFLFGIGTPASEASTRFKDADAMLPSFVNIIFVQLIVGRAFEVYDDTARDRCRRQFFVQLDPRHSDRCMR